MSAFKRKFSNVKAALVFFASKDKKADLPSEAPQGKGAAAWDKAVDDLNEGPSFEATPVKVASLKLLWADLKVVSEQSNNGDFDEIVDTEDWHAQ